MLMIFHGNNHRALSKNFHSKEFACPCCGYTLIDIELVLFLENLRRCLGKKIKINSGYRCPFYNKHEEGAEYSRHLIGVAADITWRGLRHDVMPSSRLCKEYGFPNIALNNWSKLRGLGMGENFIHVDVDENRGLKRIDWSY